MTSADDQKKAQFNEDTISRTSGTIYLVLFLKQVTFFDILYCLGFFEFKTKFTHIALVNKFLIVVMPKISQTNKITIDLTNSK